MRRRMESWIVCGAAASALLGPGPARGAENDGYLFGRIETRSGESYEGVLRWGTEEAFWDDLFHSAKTELPAMEHLPRKDREKRGGRVEVFGFRMEWKGGSESVNRQFACRFGDIERIEVTGDEDAVVHMKGGRSYEVSGYANDVGTDITVWDTSLGKVDVRWNRIETIAFAPTPSGVRPDGYRLRGRVRTDAGEFAGFIQWDSQECVSTDILDGESRDGDLEIEMGRIRAIERRGNHCRVELKDGRTLDLGGSNDVDGSIRGIMVEDERYGRVKVRWEAFERIEFEDAGGSGRGYESYRPLGPLEARVTDVEGHVEEGRIHFDLDESEGWEMLNGESLDVEYDIPFELVRTIEPRGRRSSRVELRSGETLRLGEGQDVSDRNDGVLLFPAADADPIYLAWEDVERIEIVR